MFNIITVAGIHDTKHCTWKSNILLKGETALLHFKPKLRMFCTLSQNYQVFCFCLFLNILASWSKFCDKLKNGIQILVDQVVFGDIDQCNILHVLINNSRTAGPTMQFLSFSDNLLLDNHFSKNLCIILRFWDSAQNMLNFGLGCSSPLASSPLAIRPVVRVFWREWRTPWKVLGGHLKLWPVYHAWPQPFKKHPKHEFDPWLKWHRKHKTWVIFDTLNRDICSFIRFHTLNKKICFFFSYCIP